ncbi:hypothetical protein [Pedobacter hiemivivus]|uniref:Tetratricopeptide repeat protein n=1 Tax=Pedobacter hiemivivus TaxID=2530454 RepID=A0A4R0NBB2_9SPHI|nr:hypothetical protein [Pedobacter hiemivivus]TCC96907.1 hypothetical protein EZ444_08540 [Pedobacter hiemivivus]
MKSLSKLLLFTLLLSSCASPQKLYEKGEYSKAFYAAISDLKKNPSDANALRILPDAYKEASAKYEQDIMAVKGGKGRKGERLAGIYNGYLSLQKMYDAVENANLKIDAFTPRNYTTELNQAALTAAEAHYNRGIALLQRNDRASARKAYDNLNLADSYVPGYKDVIEKKQLAHEAAITNVMVTKLDQRFGYYNINGSFFERDILWNLNNIGNSNYYEFYGLNDRQPGSRRIDQYMELSMYDIWFSNLASNNYSYTVSKQIPVKSDKMAGSVSNITVTATIRATRRIVNSRAVMDYRITDAFTHRTIAADRIPAQYTWERITGKYTGDSRALGDKERAIINGAYNNQPDYNELYRELTRQIMSQFDFRMRDIYR